MFYRFCNAARAYLGGVSLALGCLGILLFALTIPLTFFGAHFWGGFGFREGPQPTAAQLDDIVTQGLLWSFWHRLMPQLVISLALISYGLYEAYRERKLKPASYPT